MLERQTVYFPKAAMCVMWNHEFAGQMSDGVYENDPVTDTYLGIKWWNSEAVLGDSSQNDRDCPYILQNLVDELNSYQIERYIAYCIFITERPDLLDHFTRHDETLIEQAANTAWHFNSIFCSMPNENFEEDFMQRIKYITLEEVKAIFEKWSYSKAYCYTMDLVKEMDSYIH